MIQSHDLFGLELSHSFGFEQGQSNTHSTHDTTHNSGDSLLQALHQSQNSLGQEYLMNEDGQLASVVGHSSSSSHTTSTITHTHAAPAPTVVGTAGGFQIKLIWDSSVTSAPKGFMQAVIGAAQYFTSQFSNKEIININVGYGEIAGGQMSAGALGESESYGYLTNYATVTNVLAKDGFTFAATNEPTQSQFFVTSAEAKTLGLVNASATALDGYVGFGTLSGTGDSWNLTATTTGQNTGTGTHQFDLQSIALHEISEVLGRLGMEGASVNNNATYTPLDLFNFKSPGSLALSPSSGYFSTDNGTTNLGLFNDSASNGGDIADWASYQSPTQAGTQGLPAGDPYAADAFAAFGYPGYNGDISTSDLKAMAALGYTLKVPVA
jgi:hypothetical protein